MISNTIPLVFIAAVIISVLSSPAAPKKEIQCRGSDMNLNATQLQDTLDCLAKAGVSSIWKIPATDFPCFGMCMLKARGFVSADGEHIVLANVLSYINVAIPEGARPKMTELVTKCVKDHGDKVSEKNDQHCMTFMEVGQCVRDAFIDTCIE